MIHCTVTDHLQELQQTFRDQGASGGDDVVTGVTICEFWRFLLLRYKPIFSLVSSWARSDGLPAPDLRDVPGPRFPPHPGRQEGWTIRLMLA
jgi:hypothetical protein